MFHNYYYIFNQINAALLSRRDLKIKNNHNYSSLWPIALVQNSVSLQLVSFSMHLFPHHSAPSLVYEGFPRPSASPILPFRHVLRLHSTTASTESSSRNPTLPAMIPALRAACSGCGGSYRAHDFSLSPAWFPAATHTISPTFSPGTAPFLKCSSKNSCFFPSFSVTS